MGRPGDVPNTVIESVNLHNCEEAKPTKRSRGWSAPALDCFAALAMTMFGNQGLDARRLETR